MLQDLSDTPGCEGRKEAREGEVRDQQNALDHSRAVGERSREHDGTRRDFPVDLFDAVSQLHRIRLRTLRLDGVSEALEFGDELIGFFPSVERKL